MRCDNKKTLDNLYVDCDAMEEDNERSKRIDAAIDILCYVESIKNLSREEGGKEERYEIAKRMLENNLKIEEIMEYTNLKKEEIEELK